MTALEQYAALWRVPGARTLLVTSMFARFGVGITATALLLQVAASVGKVAPAGIAVSFYGLAGAVAAPIAGRLADRIGPAPVLRALALAHPAALITLIFATLQRPVNLWLIWAVAAAAGATYPPVFAAVRGAWTALTTPESGRAELRTAALAAETSLMELVFVAGPLLLAVLVAVANPTAAILTSATTTLIGVSLVARSSVMRQRLRSGQAVTRGLGPLRSPGFVVLMLCVSALGFSFGVGSVGAAAFARTHGGDSMAGILLGVWGIGSAVGGFWYGGRRFATAPNRQYGLLLLATGLGVAAPALARSALWMGLLLLVGGCLIAPAMTVQSEIVGRIVPSSMHTEAFTWLAMMTVSGSALGSSMTGYLADRSLLFLAFIVGGVAVGLGGLVALRGSLARAVSLAGQAASAEAKGVGEAHVPTASAA